MVVYTKMDTTKHYYSDEDPSWLDALLISIPVGVFGALLTALALL